MHSTFWWCFPTLILNRNVKNFIILHNNSRMDVRIHEIWPQKLFFLLYHIWIMAKKSEKNDTNLYKLKKIIAEISVTDIFQQQLLLKQLWFNMKLFFIFNSAVVPSAMSTLNQYCPRMRFCLARLLTHSSKFYSSVNQNPECHISKLWMHC